MTTETIIVKNCRSYQKLRNIDELHLLPKLMTFQTLEPAITWDSKMYIGQLCTLLMI